MLRAMLVKVKKEKVEQEQYVSEAIECEVWRPEHAPGRIFFPSSYDLDHSRITLVLAQHMPGVPRAVRQHCTGPMRALLLLGV